MPLLYSFNPPHHHLLLSIYLFVCLSTLFYCLYIYLFHVCLHARGSFLLISFNPSCHHLFCLRVIYSFKCLIHFIFTKPSYASQAESLSYFCWISSSSFVNNLSIYLSFIYLILDACLHACLSPISAGSRQTLNISFNPPPSHPPRLLGLLFCISFI